MNREQSVKIYWNKKVFIGWIILLIVLFGGTFVFLLMELTEHCTTKIPSYGIKLLLVHAAFAIPCVTIWLFSGTEAHMIFTKDGVEFRKWFHKPEFHPYKHYPYIQKAYYMYYGMPVYYIVLSNWRLTEAQRTAVNWGPASKDCIKIRYRKKQYEALLSVVPPEVAAKIRAQFQDVEVSKLDFLIL